MSSRPAYAEYERRRLGDPSGQLAGIAYMVRRSFGASSLAGFWRHWNPLFGYYLYYGCYRPLSRRLPRPAALLLTFAASGAVHDLAASLVTGRLFVLFLPAFAFFGLLVVIEEALGSNLSRAPGWFRPVVHGAILAGTIATGVVIRAAGA